MRPPAIVSWSSGKDSAYAVHTIRAAGDYELVGALTTVTHDYGRVSMHGVRESLLDQQCTELGLDCQKVRIPAPCTNEIYERAISEVFATYAARGIHHVVFGDLFLEDLREYREAQLAALGMRAVFPLWKRDTNELAKEMIGNGVRAILTCVDPRRLDASFAGRTFDEALLSELPPDVDPCGENGEFHTLTIAGPMFSRPLDVRVGEVVQRGGFVFADVIPAN